jgi:hypothetical protein
VLSNAEANSKTFVYFKFLTAGIIGRSYAFSSSSDYLPEFQSCLFQAVSFPASVN